MRRLTSLKKKNHKKQSLGFHDNFNFDSIHDTKDGLSCFSSSSSCMTFDFSSHITVLLQSSTCCLVILMSQIKLSFIKQDRRKGQLFHFQQSNRSNLLNTLSVFLLLLLMKSRLYSLFCEEPKRLALFHSWGNTRIKPPLQPPLHKAVSPLVLFWISWWWYSSSRIPLRVVLA